MSNIYQVMMNYLLCQKVILPKNVRSQWTPIVNPSHQMTEASDDRTVTADSDSSEAQDFEDNPCKLETSATQIEATLNQIAMGLQSAANGYLALASHLPNLSPYELPQIVSQIPPPPMNVPMPIRKALATDRRK